MNGSLEAFNQKVKLIYEYNHQSPLFVRLAGIEIEKNNLDNALKILTEGLQFYPEYSIVYFLIGKVHALKGKYSQALEFIKKGSELIHSTKSFDFYLREIETIKKQRSFFNISRWLDFAKENKDESKKTTINKSENSSHSDESMEDTLAKLTQEIEGATQSLKEAKNKLEEARSKSEIGNDLIATETLAQIYANQNELQAAIKVYKQLIQKNPDKANYFNAKIDELKSLLKI
jgi:tetratricopeptide (TPR) repeat protein